MRDKERFSTTDLFQFIARILSFSFKGADVKQFESEDIVGEEDLKKTKEHESSRYNGIMPILTFMFALNSISQFSDMKK